MQIHESAENYLKTILILSRHLDRVRSIDIANELGFSKPSISVAMKHLREDGYIRVDSEGSITLTESGFAIAQRIYERHAFLTDWLVALGIDRKTAALDACKIEHAISAESFAAIKNHVCSVR